MKIDFNTNEEVAIVTAVKLQLSKLQSLENKTDYMEKKINWLKSVLSKIDEANNKQAQEIMRNEG